jgi:hypothetical protein
MFFCLDGGALSIVDSSMHLRGFIHGELEWKGLQYGKINDFIALLYIDLTFHLVG